MQNFAQIMPRERECMSLNVIACNKRKGFVQGSEATKQSIEPCRKEWIASAVAR